MKNEEKKVIENGQIGIVVPKTTPELCMKYSGSADLENLCSFVGVKPSIDFEKGKLIPKFKKVTVSEGSYVFRNSFGEIRTMSEIELNNNFDVQAVQTYSKEYANKLSEKVAKVKAEKK